jgi:hypothetical protein
MYKQSYFLIKGYARQVLFINALQCEKKIELKYGCRCEDKAIESTVLARRKELKKLREKEKLFEVFDQNSLINLDLREAMFEDEEFYDAVVETIEKFEQENAVRMLPAHLRQVYEENVKVAIM